jgi:hypothetical protein
MDVSKGDMSHSSTPVGKMTLLGSKIRSPRTEHRLTWMIASWLQDAYLNTRLATDPKYLPSIMGGAGVPVLYDNPENLYLFVHAYRGGGYNRIYGTCTAELEACLNQIERGQAAVPFLSNRMRERQEYFHGTYAEKVFIPKPQIFGATGNLPPPLYEATGAENRLQSFENRLLRTRRVIPRSEAVKEQLHTEQLAHTLLGHRGSIPEAKAWMRDIAHQARAKYSMALNANSALQNLLERKASDQDVRDLLGDRAFTMITTGQRSFTKEHAQWICSGGKTATYNILDLTTSEDIYVREEVSSEETFKVPGMVLWPIVGDNIKRTVTRAKVGLYQINSTMEEWADDLLARLINRREQVQGPVPIDTLIHEFSKDVEWVNDDSTLIRQAIDWSQRGMKIHRTAILVTDDKRLANQMAQQANIRVYQLSPKDYVAICHKESIPPQQFNAELHEEILLSYLDMGRERAQPRLFIDTGSLASSMSHYDISEAGTLVRRTVIECGVNQAGKRYSQYTLTNTCDPVRLRIGAIEPIQRSRVFRHTALDPRASFSKAMSEKSWRSGSASGKA